MYFIKITPDEYVVTAAETSTNAVGIVVLFYGTADKRRYKRGTTSLSLVPGKAGSVHILDVTSCKVSENDATTVYVAKLNRNTHSAGKWSQLLAVS